MSGIYDDERLMMKDMLKPIIIFALVFGGVMPLMAQQERKFIREGNELFEKQNFEKAEVEYRKAADKKMDSFEAAFNMADALYKQKKYDEALQQHRSGRQLSQNLYGICWTRHGLRPDYRYAQRVEQN